jgi:CheY-like chemotaxis protein
MTTDRKKFGEILVANGIISRMTLQRALEKAKAEEKKIGVMLEDMGVATGEEIAAALAEQFKYKLVKNFADYSYSSDLLQIIPVDTVTRYSLFPLKLDNNNLYLAMADPTDTKIVANFATNKGLTIIPIIASRGDITAAINKHYLGKSINSDKRPTVLLVEDNVLLSTALEAVLVKAGYRVVIAKDGMEGFKKAISELPDVILTDKEMPVFDGYQLLESLKPLPETMRIPVILITASLNSTEESEAFEKGFYDFIAKPIKDVTLLTRVKRALRACEGTR